MPNRHRHLPLHHQSLPDSALKWRHMITLTCTVCGIIGGMALNAFTIAKNIASVEYVDTTVKHTTAELKAYTDDQVGKVRADYTTQNQLQLQSFDSKFKELLDLTKTDLEKAIAHSDDNRKSMEIPMAGLTVEVQGVKDLLRDFRRDFEESRRATTPRR